MFITREDLLVYMEEEELDQIICDKPEVLLEAVEDAKEFAAEMLRHRFDVDSEFDKVDSDRNRQLLKQTIAISLMYLAERLPTSVLPEAREEAYDRAEKWLKDVAEGHRQVTLTPASVEEGNQTGFPIRISSRNSRTNNTINDRSFGSSQQDILRFRSGN